MENNIHLNPNNLPTQSTPLIGREKEVDAVSKLLLRDDVRLVSLTGPGGIGKTRLGLRVAEDLIDAFESGVFLVDMVYVSNPKLVTSAITQTLGVQETAGRPLLDSLKDYLQDKEMLLLLDSFDEVDSAAALLSDLISTCPRLKILLTGRRVVGLKEEHDFSLSPLTLPELVTRVSSEADGGSSLDRYGATELFVQKAREGMADFEVTKVNAQRVIEICHRVNGLPFAIELVAAWIRMISLKAIVGRLSSQMKSLADEGGDPPTLQETMRNAIVWSYDLVGGNERILFRRIAGFIGGFTLAAAEAVCNAEGGLKLDVLDGLAFLVDRNLLRKEMVVSFKEEDSSVERVKGETRYVMPKMVREYGLERLRERGEEEAIRGHHAFFFKELAEQAEERLHGPDQVMWLDRLEAEHDNFREAMEWSKSAPSGTNPQKPALSPSQERNGVSVGVGRAELGLRLARALWWFWYVRGYFNEGRRWLEGALSVAVGVSASIRGEALYRVGALVCRQGNQEWAQELGWESLSLSRESGDRANTAWSLTVLGTAAVEEKDYKQAVAYHRESLGLWKELSDDWGIGYSLYNLGIVVGIQGDLDQELGLLEESMVTFQELGDKWGIALVLGRLGSRAYGQGAYKQAVMLCGESLSLCRELEDRGGMALALNILGFIALSARDYGQAATLLWECLSLYRKIGNKMGIIHAYRALGFVAYFRGDYERATQLFRDCLSLCRELGSNDNIIECLEGLATVAEARDESKRATRLLGAAEALRQEMGHPLPTSGRADYDRIVSLVRASLKKKAFAAAWEEGQAMSIEEAIDYAMEEGGSDD